MEKKLEEKPSLIEKITFLRNKNKLILYEYLFCSLFAAISWGYYTIKLGFHSYNIAKKYDFNLSGLTRKFTYLGKYRDFSDFQWRYFRGNYKLILYFAFIFITLSQCVKRLFSFNVSKFFYLIIGVGYGYYLHGNKIFFLFVTLITTYILCLLLPTIGSKFFIFLTWLICIIVKVTSEIYDGYSFADIGIHTINEYSILGWNACFGLNMLKIISFNIEYKNAYEKKYENNYILDLKKAKGHCDYCKKGEFCLTCLKFVKIDLEHFNFINFLIYIFYPPLYFSGPIILYHSFIFQWINFKESEHRKFLNKRKILYIIRNIITFFVFELFNHYIYINCYLTNKYNKFILKDEENNFNYFDLALYSFNNLTFLWLKFTVIWRTARIWSWLDGILTEENMNRCVYNNYCFEGFWRAWHRSFNVWLIRYIYIPLGGKKTKILNMWIVFSFVALWHDLKLNLLIWGWFICFSLIPEIIVKNYFSKPQFNYLNDKFFFRFLKYSFCSLYIILMALANLIGFGIGSEGVTLIIMKILKLTSFTYFFKILLFLIPLTVSMFYVRDIERTIYGKNVNY